MTTPRPTIWCLTSYFKGNRFLQRCKQEGCTVYLLTVQERLDSPWARDNIDEVFALPSFAEKRHVINALAYFLRTRRIDRLVALDDYDVELGAHLREHFRIPGMGETTVRHYRDKLAMRMQAEEHGIRVPRFTALHNHDDVREFLGRVPPPWLLKPRSEASSIGIRKLNTADEVWRRMEELGDDQSFQLLEEMIPGELFHVDSLVSEREVVFDEASKYFRPLLEVYQGGGIYATRILPRHLPEVAELKSLNQQVQTGFRMVRGCSHTEFLRHRDTGEFYFIETSARVGGANIAEMVEGATGLNLWSEWAKIEVEAANGYQVPAHRSEYGGVTISLARQERPDTTSFNDPEIFFRLDHKHHVGLAVRSQTFERVESLLNDYVARIARDYHATLPPADKATA